MADMTVIRVEKNNNYVVMANYHLRDKGLSLKAKGLMSFLLSLPPKWDMSVQGLACVLSESKNTVNRILQELENNCYMQKKRVKKGNKFAGYEYTIYEKPYHNFTYPQNEDIQNEDLQNGYPKNEYLQNEPQINIKEISIDKNNGIKEINNKEISIDNNTLSGTPDRVGEITSQVINYLNEVAGKSFKATTPKTKTLIKARLKEGFVLHDFKVVIDKKCRQWLGSDMEKYIRPETLFSPKFEGYLNEPDTVEAPKQKKHEETPSERAMRMLNEVIGGQTE